MIEYDGSRCEPHGQVRCITCMALAAKGKKPAPKPTAPPPEITGAPPADLEGLSVRDREPKTQEEVNTEYDKILAEVNALRTAAPGIMVEFSGPNPPMVVNQFARDTFETLPTDDSHASKVLRAASEFACAAQAWAQELAYVEKVKKILLTAEAELSRVTKKKTEAEDKLKQLVTGEFQGDPKS